MTAAGHTGDVAGEPGPHDKPPTYAVITPARNEATRLPETITSMLSQTATPVVWCIVDDGSTDGTGSVADRAAAGTPWIHAIHRSDRGFREAGGGVVDAVLQGLRAIEGYEWDFLVKLDADLRFDAEYFASCLDAFTDDPSLGIAGGTVYNLVDGERIPEPHPRFHVRGATKIYRRACWDAIGGIVAAPGWDTIDEVTANQLGWTTRTLDVPIDQLRSTGTAAGDWSNWTKNGRAAYLSGYHPLFVLARAGSRLTKAPYATASLGLTWGYLAAARRREPRLVDETTADFVRTQQLNRLIGRESMWR